MNREEINYPVGTQVIGLSNEWDNMIVGTIKKWEPMPGETSLPLIFDLVTQKEYVVMGVLIYYSETVLKSLCSLNPYERWNIASKGISPINEKKLKYNPDYCMTLDDYLLVIEKAGWFKLKKNTP